MPLISLKGNIRGWKRTKRCNFILQEPDPKQHRTEAHR
jgi:hypothetical protein